MQVVIDVSDEEYEWIKQNPFPMILPTEFEKAIQNGTPLPKGHGRLIDASRLRSMYSINQANFNTVVGIQKWIDNAPTVLEASQK